jgi:hypothetical protein
MHEPALKQKVFDGLDSSNADTQRAAVRISLEHFLSDPKPSPP